PELLQRFEVGHRVLGQKDPLFRQGCDEGLDVLDVARPGPTQVQTAGKLIVEVVVSGDTFMIEIGSMRAHGLIQHHCASMPRKSPGTRRRPTPRTLPSQWPSRRAATIRW